MGQLFSKKNKEVFSAPLGIDNQTYINRELYAYVVSKRLDRKSVV